MQRSKSTLSEILEAFERSFIINTMQEQDWSRKKTAQVLGIPMSTLKYKMTKLGIYKVVPGRRNDTSMEERRK